MREDDAIEWESVTGWGVASYLFFALLILWLSHTEGHWVFLLDNANLALHEAGHPAFSLISDRLTVYGGTVMQLVFPLAAGFHFYRRGETLSVAFAVLWLGENLFNIAVYMADARVQILPLVGNGEHDWTEIFSRWGVLDWDAGIAALVRGAGWLLIIAAGLWLGYRHREVVR